MQGVTLSQQQFTVELFVFSAVELQLGNALLVEARQVDVQAVVEYLRRGSAPVGGAKHATTVVEVVLEFHIADGA
ncbi:hypothetical protein D9M69_376600 [compost metagenome]